MAKLRNPKNIVPVADGEVFVSFADNPKFDVKGNPDDSWHTIGILNDGSRVALNRVIEKNKTLGWGFGVVAVDTKPGDLTSSAETLEDNEATREIAWPSRSEGNSKRIDGAEILHHDEKVATPFVAMVERMQNGKTRIRISRERAIATMEDIGFGQEITGKEVQFEFLTGSNKDAFDEIIIEDSNKDQVNSEIKRFVEQLEQKDKLNVKVTLPKNVSGGTWSLALNGKPVIEGLAHNVSASTLKQKLAAVEGISDVVVKGNATSGFTITLTGVSGATGTGTSLTGGDSTDITVAPQS